LVMSMLGQENIRIMLSKPPSTLCLTLSRTVYFGL
jgi:hypothetical protein